MLKDNESNQITDEFIGEVLWTGSFTSGSITVPNMSKYTLFAVDVGGVMCFGTKDFGFGGIVKYGLLTFEYRGYRLNYNTTNETFTIDSISKGGSNGTSQDTINRIIGIC